MARVNLKTMICCGPICLATFVGIVAVANDKPDPKKSGSQCGWELFDLRVDPPSISISGKVDLLLRCVHPAGGSIFVDFGGTAGTMTSPLTNGCDKPDGFFVFSADPGGIGTEIVVQLLDASSKVRAMATTHVPPASMPPLSIEVVAPNGPPYKISDITWSPNTTITLALLRAQNRHELDFTPGHFSDQYGSMLGTCHGYTPTGSEYWALYVNGKYSYFGMDSMILAAGDAVKIEIQSPSSHNDVEKNTHQFRLVQSAQQSK